jgi:hypothetical protein
MKKILLAMALVVTATIAKSQTSCCAITVSSQNAAGIQFESCGPTAFKITTTPDSL